ncbi:RNA binding protein, putative [Trypanosoma cruzi]|nr:RNA binding protein, putative [Trypanosoma cruzi]
MFGLWPVILRGCLSFFLSFFLFFSVRLSVCWGVGVPAWRMVSFTCNYCHDVVKKPKVNGHAAQCGGASFTCVDCMEVFDLQTIKQHTSCITETEKYQGRWRQNRAPAAAARRCVDGSDDSDGDGNDNNKRQPLRPPRPPMNLSSDSDSDDDAWVTGGKKKAVMEQNKERNGSSNGSSQKRAKTTSPSNKNMEAKSGSKRQKHEELLELPRAVTAADCIVPSFVLGTDEEVAEVTRWIIEEAGEKSLTVRALAKKLVERYNTRIAKHVRHAIETAIQNGKLRVEGGTVNLP